MDDVKKYNAYADGLTVHFEADSEGAWASADDFDAQRLRADTAEAERNQLLNDPNNVFKKMCDMALKQRDEAMSKLAAAEQRNAELSAQNQQLKRLLRDSKANLNPSGRLAKAIDAALNPNPEAESHEKH